MTKAKRQWVPARTGCDGVHDNGNGAIRYIEVNSDYPGVQRVTVRTYCRRPTDNCRFYQLVEGPGRFTTLDEARRAALRDRP